MKKKFTEIDWPCDMPISRDTASLLWEISKWAKFLSIVGFVMLGLLLITILAGGSMMSTMIASSGMYGAGTAAAAGATTVYIITYLITFAIGLVLMILLFKFATDMRKALVSQDTAYLNKSFGSLKNYYMVNGIITIVALAFIVLAVIFALIGAAAYM